ncbi:S-adenosylmethionine-dependent methyltransferase Rv2258c-like [Argopecten irradians]|uniref:S-adenosylmethionine-dependent methyltransferase Rv2258c-like n=1 Tax=Argopecten irradians TaxID=31199 RepID=UPI003715AC46
MNSKYLQVCKRIISDPLLQSGMNLGLNLKVFEAINANKEPCDISTLAHITKLKELYLKELIFSYVSSGLLHLKDGRVSIPDYKIFKEIIMSQQLNYMLYFQKVAPGLEKCFAKDGPPGYDHEEAQPVMEFILSQRTFYNKPIAKELCEVISTFAEKYGNVLDLGCGSGELTIQFAIEMKGSKVHGCDISSKAIERANGASFDVPNLNFSKEDIHKLPEAWTEKFDVVLLYDVLHDLQFPGKAMEQVMRVLKKEGIVIIVDPKVSSNPQNNVGNMLAAKALTTSIWWCIPSSSCNNGSGHGVSWGWEKKEAFLLGIKGLEIRNQVCLVNSDYNFAYICKKK